MDFGEKNCRNFPKKENFFKMELVTPYRDVLECVKKDLKAINKKEMFGE
jgi:hypothetical protein